MADEDDIIAILEKLDDHSAKEFESERLEFKKFPDGGLKDLYDLAIEYSICFANSRGGILIIGIDEKKKGFGSILGCPGNLDFSQLKERVYNETEPKICIDWECLNFKGKELLMIKVPKTGRMHTDTSGRGKVRKGTSCVPLTGSLIEQWPFFIGNKDFSSQTIQSEYNAIVDDREIDRLKEKLNSLYSSSPLLSLKKQDFLKSLRIIRSDDNNVCQCTFAGLLLIGREDKIYELLPQHEITYLQMESQTEYRIRKDIRYPLLRALDVLTEAISSSNPIFTIRVGLFQPEIPAFDKDVYREGILNAVTHRDYANTGGRIIIKHWKNRMEITNPGGFLDNITPKNILKAEPRSRNPLLAEALQQLRLVERAGIGVDRMYKIQLSNGKEPPKYETNGEEVKLILLDGDIDEQFATFVREEQNEGRELDLDELLILSKLTKEREISLPQVADILLEDDNLAKNTMRKLIDFEYVEKSGKTKGVIYHLRRSIYDRLGKSILYIREKGIDELKHEELIISYIEEYGSISNRQARKLLSINQFSASRLLNKLVRAGKIEKTGITKGAKYIMANK